MKCVYCDRQMTTKLKNYPYETKELGMITIPDVEFYACTRRNCNNELLSEKEAMRVDSIIDEKIREAVNNLPIGQFIDLNETAEILGKTKQAISKSKRIKRGFIYSVEISKKKLYYKPSVEAFGKDGDGRILISDTAPESAYILPDELIQSLHVTAEIAFVDDSRCAEISYPKWGEQTTQDIHSTTHPQFPNQGKARAEGTVH